MFRRFSILIVVTLGFAAPAAAQGNILVPAPLSLEKRAGTFVFADRPCLLPSTAASDGIEFVIDSSMKDEAYILDVSPRRVIVRAKDERGLFYGLQGIRQLLPAGYEDSSCDRYAIPCLKVYDEPRFPYRGFMLDVARFFTPKEDLLKIIDCMSMLKLNKLHLHLCDDNGWRIEIKRYPLLHEVGSRRVERPGEYFSERLNARQGEPTVPGGYYTQDDIREIVSYAAERQIEVIPEIEMPAHSNAALAAYPLLACPVVDKFIGVLPGLGGNHADIIFCAGNDEVFKFLEDVLDEVMELFPSKIIHLGGDEAWKTHWKECPLCQQRIREESLADEEALQGWFMARIADYVHNHGREVAGWDELTETGIPEDAIVYGWRGMGQAALDAARLGHRVVMTPAKVTYLIRYQGPQWFEPLTYFGNNRLCDIYDYEPLSSDWTPEMAGNLIGVQASLWTEFCSNVEDVNYLAFPRLAALSEVAWTRPENKSWERFQKSVDAFSDRLGRKGLVPARSMFNIQHTVLPEDGRLKVVLECERTDVQIRYTTDGSEPCPKSSLYRKPLFFDGDVEVRAATFRDGRMTGKVLTLPLKWNKATAASLMAGGSPVLLNGVRGSLRRSDFEWVALSEGESVCVDLGRVTDVNSVIVGSINDFGMAVHLPSKIVVSLSIDGEVFEDAGEWKLSEDLAFARGTFVKDLTVSMDNPVSARYVSVKAVGQGRTPALHCRPDNDTKMYFDEIIVQ
ncbi:MAG: family 20 glycosylhydrolase [Candidatus Cryptobacteroides sp.]